MSPGEIDRARFIASLKAAGALQFGTFTLSSGRTSPYYVDIKRAVTRPDLLRTIADGMAPFARDSNRIACVELGAVPIAAAVGLASGKPYIMVRKASKEHGTKKEIEGNFASGDSVVVVDDVITTGASTIQAIDAIEEAVGRVAFVLVLVDREEGGKLLLAEISVRLQALLSSKDLLNRA